MVEDGGTEEKDLEATEAEETRWAPRGEIARDAGLPAVR